LAKKCAANVEPAAAVPRQYRHTGRAEPTKPSEYVGKIFTDVGPTLSTVRSLLGPQTEQSWRHSIAVHTAERLETILKETFAAVTKMEESLSRLKKLRKNTDKTASAGMSDDSKIRLQLWLDARAFGEALDEYGVERHSVPAFERLWTLAEDAKRKSDL